MLRDKDIEYVIVEAGTQYNPFKFTKREGYTFARCYEEGTRESVIVRLEQNKTVISTEYFRIQEIHYYKQK